MGGLGALLEASRLHAQSASDTSTPCRASTDAPYTLTPGTDVIGRCDQGATTPWQPLSSPHLHFSGRAFPLVHHGVSSVGGPVPMGAGASTPGPFATGSVFALQQRDFKLTR